MINMVHFIYSNITNSNLLLRTHTGTQTHNT